MSTIDTAIATIHLLFAGLWAGSVMFMTRAVLPTALDGDIGVEPLRTMTSKLRMNSRVSSLVLFVTGGHLAGTGYTFEALAATTQGNLVLGMVVLWFLLTGLVEMGGRRIVDGLDEQKIRTPAQKSKPFFQAAAVIAALLLVVGGILV